MRKERMVGARLPRGLVRDLERIERTEQADRSTTIRKLLARAIADWKLEHCARLYGDGKLTLARAARDAGVSLWEMMDYVRSRKISVQYDLDDFEQDVKTVYGRLGRG
jgi:predicted HTH domain antitoxin